MTSAQHFAYNRTHSRHSAKAKIIDVRRNPLIVCSPDFKQMLAAATRILRWPTWGNITRLLDLMAHYNTVLPGKITGSFIRLVEEPSGDSELLAYLELPFEEQCLRFYESGRRSHLQFGAGRMPIFKHSLAVGEIQPWIAPLKRELE